MTTPRSLGPVLACAAAVLVAALSVAPALATEPVSCTDALNSYNVAQKAADKAKDADKAAVEAKADDDAAAAARAAMGRAQTAAVNGGLTTAQLTADGIATLRTERTTLQGKPKPLSATDQDRLIVLDREIPLGQAFLDKQAAHKAAQNKADATDAAALQGVADRTDAAALQKTADDAKTVSDAACKGADGATVTATVTPAPIVPTLQVLRVPRGAVNTGQL